MLDTVLGFSQLDCQARAKLIKRSIHANYKLPNVVFELWLWGATKTSHEELVAKKFGYKNCKHCPRFNDSLVLITYP